MKTSLLLIPLGVALAGVATVRADGAKKATADCCDAGGCGPGKPAGPTAPNQPVMITGSLIPARAGLVGKMYAHTFSPVVVITRADLQRMGARDVADALHRSVSRAR